MSNLPGNTKRNPVPILSVMRPKTVERFRAKLRPEGDCLVWTGTRNKAGYGIIDVSYESKARRYCILTHRLAWALAAQRDPPADKIICHRCNNPSCCKSAHLYLGTQQDNANDKVASGRQARPLLGVRGVAHPRALYTDEQKGHAIRLVADGMPIARAAKIIGCVDQTVDRWWLAYERRCGEVGRVQALVEFGDTGWAGAASFAKPK